ncbi:hypothetical protein LZ575_16530 [Antarcticibacterium sp. 1MA-6-2]|uniref:hypothetical protein n=1 Tax=Antarcticibacterium sp. 1MA-6-2 TaxID=2908210 RepID=UPI001F32957D|nr:hypothetical protein [Antarcticibacterium sp. 1MA-6-2]UJH90421.1 hypothetical protein LZ575_16530 [Antarcticibacterium sp. 1MA-6-2]
MNSNETQDMVKETISFPVIYDSKQQTIWDSKGMMVCDIKGWGKIQFMGNQKSGRMLLEKKLPNF